MRVLVPLLFVLLALPCAQAHVTVVPGSGDSPANATALGLPPARAFDELPATGGYHYYSIVLDANESVRLRLLAREDAFPDALPPALLLIGEPVADSGLRPKDLPLPERAGVLGFAGTQRAPGLDARYPLPYVTLVDREFAPNQTGRYYLVVYSEEGGGSYAVFAETGPSPLLDAYLVPASRPSVFSWSGEPYALMLGGFAVGALLALALLLAARWRGTRFAGITRGGAAIAAVLYAASASSMTLQTARLGLPVAAAWQAWALALLYALLAGALVAAATAPGEASGRRRALVIGIGVVGAVAWAGLVIGPALAILSALLPEEPQDAEGK